MIITQVGRRWFICRSVGLRIDVEVSYGNGTEYIRNPEKSIEAGYNVYDWIHARKWNITGKGARKYRDEIIEAIEAFIQKVGVPL